MILNCVVVVFSLLMAGAAIQRLLTRWAGVELAVTVIWLLTGLYMLMVVIGQAGHAQEILHAV